MIEEKLELFKTETLEDFYDFDAKVCKRLRDEYYNWLLMDKNVREHIQKLFDVSGDVIENVLVINNMPPLDDFPEE